ncbi:MAG: L-seryl-tRNA(Sec) selenium transferase [Lentisphaerales bacterium]|nr:MAG: L-seryl-tRNA(Sec) selenium transferase [Lentisphaerales bacterium]
MVKCVHKHTTCECGQTDPDLSRRSPKGGGGCCFRGIRANGYRGHDIVHFVFKVVEGRSLSRIVRTGRAHFSSIDPMRLPIRTTSRFAQQNYLASCRTSSSKLLEQEPARGLTTMKKKGDSEQAALRALPSVDQLLQTQETVGLVRHHGRPETIRALREAIEGLRARVRRGERPTDPEYDPGTLAATAATMLEADCLPSLRQVINGTGIILHTGLGRAVMPPTARDALGSRAGYCNVQMDLANGSRMHREQCISDLVRDLTGAEEALVVNNNAGATLLLLKALSEGREVIVSRGEQVEIGGSFRLPDIMSESGAIMKEVGTTNKTHARDYEQAIGPNTALLLKVHKSNYNIVGFTKEVGIGEIASIGARHGIPAVDDLGCGALVDLEQFGLDHEVTIRESIKAGAAAVLSSADKLIGGPQGGLIVGRKELLDRIRSHPMYRVLRVCKLTLAGLEATLRLFKAPDLLAERHPVYRMISRQPGELEEQANTLAARLREVRPGWEIRVVGARARLGGGSLPWADMPSFAVSIVSASEPAEQLATAFRLAPVPVITRVKDDVVLIDMRTVMPDELDDMVEAAGAGKTEVR